MKKLHYYSGLTLSLFIGVHLLNHLAALISAEAHIQVMDIARFVYRNPIVEALLLVAVASQLVSGISLIFKKEKKGLFNKLHIASGIYLALFMPLHVTATFYFRSLGGDTDIYFGAGGLHAYPSILFFLPYYSLAVMSVFTHVGCVHRKKIMERNTSQAVASRQARWIMLTGILITTAIMFGMMTIEMPS